MNRVRKLEPAQASLAPVGQNQWNQLLRKALGAAELAKDPRLATLRQAMMSGTAEKTLRRMSLICEADLQREFPVSQT